MDKKTILNELTTTGQITVFRRTPLWETAFNLYNTGHTPKLRPSCGSCFRTVLDWLKL